MKTKNSSKRLIGLLVALVILIAAIGVGTVTGVFEDIGDAVSMIAFNPRTILNSFIVIAFLYALHALIQLILDRFKGTRNRKGTMVTVISSFVKYGIVIIGACWVLTIMGVNVSTIFASVGVVALIVGFGAESLVADIVTGLFIIFENQFNVGDIIEVDGFRGTVDNISIRTISLRDAGGNIKIINNSDLANVVNRSNNGSIAVCEVGVSYDTDLDMLESRIGGILDEIKAKHPTVFIDKVEYLGVEELADSSVVLKIKADVKEKDIFSGRRILNKEIKCAFDREHITIAFPQIDVHTK